MRTRKIAVLGAGGFAREVAWLIRDINKREASYEFLGYIVSDLAKLGDQDSRSEVLGDYSWLEQNQGKLDALAIGIGTPKSRLRVGTDLGLSFPKFEWPELIHPSAQFDRATAKIGQGAIICAGVIGTVNVVLESFTMVNLACTIGHEAQLGQGCVLNPTVNISGGVVLEEGVLVGTGAQILQYVRVGRGATIGAGAVVTKAVSSGETVVGIPARAIKKD